MLPASDYADQWPVPKDGDSLDQHRIPEPALLSQATYPYWGRATIGEHVATTIGGTWSKKKIAGFPDMLLFPNGDLYRDGAIAEVKAWWSTSTASWQALWTDPQHRIVQEDGTFRASRSDPMRDVVAQVSSGYLRLMLATDNLVFIDLGRIVLLRLSLRNMDQWSDHGRFYPHGSTRAYILSYSALDGPRGTARRRRIIFCYDARSFRRSGVG